MSFNVKNILFAIGESGSTCVEFKDIQKVIIDDPQNNPIVQAISKNSGLTTKEMLDCCGIIIYAIDYLSHEKTTRPFYMVIVASPRGNDCVYLLTPDYIVFNHNIDFTETQRTDILIHDRYVKIVDFPYPILFYRYFQPIKGNRRYIEQTGNYPVHLYLSPNSTTKMVKHSSENKHEAAKTHILERFADTITLAGQIKTIIYNDECRIYGSFDEKSVKFMNIHDKKQLESYLKSDRCIDLSVDSDKHDKTFLSFAAKNPHFYSIVSYISLSPDDQLVSFDSEKTSLSEFKYTVLINSVRID